MHPTDFQYGSDRLTVATVIALASGGLDGSISAAAGKKIRESRQHVADIAASQRTVYGINTGFGILANTKISEEDTRILQHKILQSHSVGVGNPIPEEIAKLMLITKVHALAQGYSGIPLATLERIIWHIDNDIIPVVPEKGSVGASGDLAPLAHLFLPLIGFGEVSDRGKIVPAAQMLKSYALEPIKLGPKEGLALINGTQFILSFAVKAVQRMHNALQLADLAGAMSLEGLMGSARPFDPRLHEIRPYKGSKLVAA